jgi:hypothetical protein
MPSIERAWKKRRGQFKGGGRDRGDWNEGVSIPIVLPEKTRKVRNDDRYGKNVKQREWHF